MFIYDKKLQYPVKIDRPNPRLAAVIISQYGGPDGELGASLRYLSQRYSMPFDELKGLLTDIGTEGSKNNSLMMCPEYEKTMSIQNRHGFCINMLSECPFPASRGTGNSREAKVPVGCRFSTPPRQGRFRYPRRPVFL